MHGTEKLENCRKLLTNVEKSDIILYNYLWFVHRSDNIDCIMLLLRMDTELYFFTHLWSEYSIIQNRHSVWRHKRMRNPSEREIKKEVVLQQCFECLTEKGIESITIKDFSTATGMAMSSIYYWFEDKDEIVLDAVEWGLRENVDKIFNFAFSYSPDLKDVCDGILKIAQDKKREFRLIFQVATSPQYGDKIREFAKHLEHVYKRYTEQLSKELNVSFDELYPYINMSVSSFVDCVIWDDWEKLKLELNCLVKNIVHFQKCSFRD